MLLAMMPKQHGPRDAVLQLVFYFGCYWHFSGFSLSLPRNRPYCTGQESNVDLIIAKNVYFNYTFRDWFAWLLGAHIESLRPNFYLRSDLYNFLHGLFNHSFILGPWELVSNLSHCWVTLPKFISLHFLNYFSKVLKIYNITCGSTRQLDLPFNRVTLDLWIGLGMEIGKKPCDKSEFWPPDPEFYFYVIYSK